MLLEEIVQVRVDVCLHTDRKTPEVFCCPQECGVCRIYIGNGKEVKLKRNDGELPDNNGVCLFSEHALVFCFDPFPCKHTIR